MPKIAQERLCIYAEWVSDYNKIHRQKLVLAVAVPTAELSNLQGQGERGGRGEGGDICASQNVGGKEK